MTNCASNTTQRRTQEHQRQNNHRLSLYKWFWFWMNPMEYILNANHIIIVMTCFLNLIESHRIKWKICNILTKLHIYWYTYLWLFILFLFPPTCSLHSHSLCVSTEPPPTTSHHHHHWWKLMLNWNFCFTRFCTTTIHINDNLDFIYSKNYVKMGCWLHSEIWAESRILNYFCIGIV